MRGSPKFEIFLSTAPGLELTLKEEVLEAGFKKPKAVPGGVSFRGNWEDVWRANLVLRGANRVLARIGRFKAMHLTQLEREADAFPWGQVLERSKAYRVEATCKGSKIYHQGAAKERLERAISDGFGAGLDATEGHRVQARIENDICTLSIDTSGDLLHRRGQKEAVGKAPMRETVAAMFLRQCGYRGTEPVLDPLCGSGTFVIEAAEIAGGHLAGRSRRFAFEDLATFDAATYAALRSALLPPEEVALMFHGSDRDAGAIRGAQANANRAGVGAITQFACHSISDLTRPEGAAGLVIVNPPYGDRIGDKRQLFGLYGALGKVLMQRFAGWRVGLVTSDTGLARASGLPFGDPSAAVAHGGLNVRLWQTGALHA